MSQFGWARWPLRTRMAILLAATSLLPLSMWAFIDLYRDHERVLEGLHGVLQARSDQLVRELDSFNRSYLRTAESIVHFPAVADRCAADAHGKGRSRDALHEALAGYHESDPAIRGAALLDGSGRVVVAATQGGLEALDPPTRKAVALALRGRPVISDPYVPPTDPVPTIAYVTPRVGPDGQALCLAVLWLEAASVWQTVEASHALAGPGSFATVVDREGIRIAHSSRKNAVFRPAGPLDTATLERLTAERRFGPRTRELLEEVLPWPGMFERARAAAPSAVIFNGMSPATGIASATVARRLETAPWTVFYMTPTQAIDGELAEAKRERLLLAGAVIATAALVGVAFGGSIVRPLRRLDRAAAALAAGDFTVRVPTLAADEIGRLASTFNAMAARIQSQTEALRRAHGELEQRVRERTAELQRTTEDLEAQVAQRSRVEDELRERDAALHRAHEMARLAHVITGRDGSFESWSETLPPLVGLTPATMPPSTRAWLDLLHPQDRERFRAESLAARRRGTPYHVEYRLRRGDGAWIHVRQGIEPIPGTQDASGRGRWFSTLQDVTQLRQADAALRESQQLLQSVIDNSAAVIYVKDLEGRYELVNRRHLEIFRVGLDAVIGRTDLELFPREIAEPLRDLDRRVVAAAAPLIEEEVVPQDGELRTFVSVKCPLRGPDGQVRAVLGVSTDITDRKRAEDALRASEERTRQIIETALDAVVTMDAAGLVTGWSARAEATFGWTRDEALGQPLAQLIVPPHLRERHVRGLARYLDTGMSTILNRRIELTGLHRDGREFPVDLAVTEIQEGGARAFSAFVRDISERKLAQQRLEAQLQRMTLLDHITRGIAQRQDLRSIHEVAIGSLEEQLPVDYACICRHDDDVLTVVHVGAHSQPLAQRLAMDEQARVAIDGSDFARCLRGELVHEPDILQVASPFARRLAAGGLRSLVVVPLQSENRVFGVLVAARRQPDAFSSGECEFLRQLAAHVALAAGQAELYGALQQAYDDLRQSQQIVLQQERLRALGEMASGIAHDINNAISPVSLYAESLLERETGISERGRGYLVTIARAIDDVAATVARLREFYRQREPQAYASAVSLNALVEQVAELTRARWRDMPLRHGAVVELRSELAPDLPPVLGSETEIREALVNLVLNAVDAMPDGGTLGLRTHAADGRVSVAVYDSGNGMDETTRRRCMEPFFTTKGERGTGLGLAIVYGVAQRHGAGVDIESAPGRGTTVRLVFPAAQQASAAAAPSQPSAAAMPRLSILIVDDDPVLLLSLHETLALDGHRVVAANGGRAGIEAFADAATCGQPFEVVITDLGMPHVDGRKVAQAVRERDPAVPVIMLTGWGQRMQAEDDLPPHVDRVLGKPPKLSELRAVLAELVARAPGARPEQEVR